MIRSRPTVRLAVALSAFHLAALASASAGGGAPARDPHSRSEPWRVAVTRLALELTPDFSAQRLAGRASWTIERRDPTASELVLDVHDLDVDRVTLDADPAPVAFRLGADDPALGRSLTIPIAAATRVVHVDYRTRPEAAALLWLEPAQTADRKSPFLFTQSEAILARTWVPCQDSPAVRFTYEATVHAPQGLLALMSAENPTAKSADGTYRFRMRQPIPSYLLALAVGDLEFRPLGKRTGVYAEPSVVGKAAWELADTEKMIAAAEKLYGPYRWGRYDLIVLPPSFPYGGMENPRLTFATPTILAGDRSLVSLVAHELAHSWSGNLVTNATWNDFWLNEGFTSYFENRIVESLYGKDAAEMNWLLARQELDAAVARIGATHPDTALRLSLAGRDPDLGTGDIAYDKGSFFLRKIEETVGRARFDAFLRRYFDTHAFRGVTTDDFLADLDRDLLTGHDDWAKAIDPPAWVDRPGIPAAIPKPSSRAFDRVDSEVGAWLDGIPASQLASASWSTQEWLRFLHQVPRYLNGGRVAELDRAFGLSRSGNAEILCAWFELALQTRDPEIYPELEKFLSSMGRAKFLRPLYTALAATPEGKDRARAIYAKARSGYHPVSRAAIDPILDWQP
jgi:hypothetical protein